MNTMTFYLIKRKMYAMTRDCKKEATTSKKINYLKIHY